MRRIGAVLVVVLSLVQLFGLLSVGLQSDHVGFVVLICVVFFGLHILCGVKGFFDDTSWFWGVLSLVVTIVWHVVFGQIAIIFLFEMIGGVLLIVPRTKKYINVPSVYYCSRCGSIESSRNDKPRCPSCGNHMSNTGYTSEEWASLSSEEIKNIKTRWLKSSIETTTRESIKNEPPITEKQIVNITQSTPSSIPIKPSFENSFRTWLRKEGFDDIIPIIEKNDLFDYEILFDITEDELKEIGITSLGARKKIRKYIQNYVSDQVETSNQVKTVVNKEQIEEITHENNEELRIKETFETNEEKYGTNTIDENYWTCPFCSHKNLPNAIRCFNCARLRGSILEKENKELEIKKEELERKEQHKERKTIETKEEREKKQEDDTKLFNYYWEQLDLSKDDKVKLDSLKEEIKATIFYNPDFQSRLLSKCQRNLDFSNRFFS